MIEKTAVYTQKLVDIANSLVANDKGLLAIDESTPTCNKRFAKLGIAETEDRRRAYREMLVTTPGLGDCISGVILYDEPDFDHRRTDLSVAIAVRIRGASLAD